VNRHDRLKAFDLFRDDSDRTDRGAANRWPTSEVGRRLGVGSDNYGVSEMQRRDTTRQPGITRRRLLKTIGIGSAGVALGGATTATEQVLAQETPETAPHQWAFVIDLRRCDGCDKCVDACQKAHYLAKDQTWIKVYWMKDATGKRYAMPRLCMHCEVAPCVRVCPVTATYRNNEGVVLVDQNVCIGCRTCMAACPYEARYFNWSNPPPTPTLLTQTMPEFPVPQQMGTVGKCILCVHNTDMGKLPVCVEGCPMGALYIGDLKSDIATNGQESVKLSKFLRENDAFRYREELGTRPRVWYIAGHGQKFDL
jgi:dimethyl sulfoxide reductase iron-sulfur subunit